MNRLLSFLFFISLFGVGFSQEDQNNGSTAFDFADAKRKRPLLVDKRLRIGYGLQVPVIARSSLQTTPNTIYTDYSWLTKNPTHVIDLGMMFGFLENWTFGVTMAIQPLGRTKEKFEYEPSSDAMYYRPLRTTYKTIGRAYGNTVYAERRLYSTYNDHFRIVSRLDLGFNRYSAVAKILYKDEYDSCNCYVSRAKSRTGTTVLTADLNVGLQHINRLFGAKLSVGYRIQTPGKLIMKDELANWEYNFNEDDYDFNGEPDKKLFSIKRPATERAEIMHQRLYVQFSLFLVLGKRDFP